MQCRLSCSVQPAWILEQWSSFLGFVYVVESSFDAWLCSSVPLHARSSSSWHFRKYGILRVAWWLQTLEISQYVKNTILQTKTRDYSPFGSSLPLDILIIMKRAWTRCVTWRVWLSVYGLLHPDPELSPSKMISDDSTAYERSSDGFHADDASTYSQPVIIDTDGSPTITILLKDFPFLCRDGRICKDVRALNHVNIQCVSANRITVGIQSGDPPSTMCLGTLRGRPPRGWW